ncbi:type II secretion system protein [Phycisphaera mikurensis]|uniref:Prepilin-type N-terminal cleavage/methylation domain-containing protein n=1 Tax=Phycisphaera mikurensis (strain NBRC 102666 / KCTC 22515 / FYK2301M01) TaxID=1142394 RepID=I0ICT9_PHYMF|nr:type II secretion system protein [Phycisphaera mikurensis]MBB6443304.1 prepilin-type N-terminal cleavage/methylation domain-containing protein [Phycisphaera mikurensis]BAM03077.1 hypothetical protein PSMK_09180 [Phycisphaera mikurensis NBRC 102666]
MLPPLSLQGRPSRPGFTLIELLVVISIIALLVGILLPALGAARTAAKSMQCLSQIKQFGIAQFSYMNDRNGILAPAQWADADGGTSHWYESNEFMSRIPGVTNDSSFAGNDTYQEASNEAGFLVCPLDESVADRYTNPFWEANVSYGMNQAMGVDPSWYGGSPRETINYDSITSASEMMLMVDWVEIPRVNWPIAGTPYLVAYNDWFVPNIAGTPENNLKYADWHGGDASNDPNASQGNVNAAFMDGRAANVTFALDNPYYDTDLGSDFWMGGLQTLPDNTTSTYAGGRSPKY